MLYLANFFDPVQQLSQLYNTFLSATAALDRIIGVLDEEPEIVDAPDARELPPVAGARPLRARRLRLRRASRTSCTGSTSTCPPGTTVALVGHTGAGKSTIAKLLTRFYDPRAGRITIDGHDIREVTQESLRRQLGIVPQEGFLFAGTVADNIAFGRPDASREEIVAAGVRRRRGRVRRRRSRTATTRSSASAGSGSRSASASSSRSRARCSPTRASSSSTRRPRPSTSAPSGESSSGLRRLLAGPHGVRHRAPPVDDPARRPASSCSTTAASSSRARTRSSWPPAARTRGCTATGPRTRPDARTI